MKILFIGDIVGRIGREAVEKVLSKYKNEYNIDLVIANGENLSHGTGITEKNLKEMLNAGIDLFTSGNHIWNRKEVYQLLDHSDTKILRPYNYPEDVPGIGYKLINIGIKSIIVLNLIGRVFMRECVNCPFKAADEVLKQIKPLEPDAVIVDFHAEATSEKVAFYKYMDGKVTAIIGTHTHIPTADMQISEKGTSYITDVGACYAKDSVIGVNKDVIIKGFLTSIPQAHSFPTHGICTINAVILDITNDGKTKNIKQILEEVEI